MNAKDFFFSVADAVAVLGKRTTRSRLEALQSQGVDLSQYTHRQLAEIVCASREKVVMAMVRMGLRRKAPYGAP